MEHKTCTRCLKMKPLTAFPLDRDKRRSTVGVKSQCKACANERAKQWQRDNYDRAFATQKAWRQDNRERWNASMVKVGRKYRKAKDVRTPPWADSEKIKAIYDEAAALRALGVDAEVDHIVPLRGRYASGLHVHQNLQIILATDNRKKRNFWKPETLATPHPSGI